MAAAAILNFIYRSQLAYYCTYFLRNLASVLRWISHTYAKILNKNKIQDVFAQTVIIQPLVDTD